MESRNETHSAEFSLSEPCLSGKTEPESGVTHPHRRGIHVFCPHKYVEKVSQVSPNELVARGIRGLLLDLDNTLVPWRREAMADEVIAWLESIKAADIKLCILSNSILSKRSARIAEKLGCSYIRKARKPSIQGFRRAMTALETTPATTAIVGDQMFTDIWGGNRVGIYTIMVRPIHHSEFVYTRFVSRPPERLLLRWFKRRGHLS